MSDIKKVHFVASSINKEITYNEIVSELFRKGIHLMVALVPLVASINMLVTQVFLLTAVVLYTVCESVRLSGRNVVFVSNITSLASRPRDKGRFVMGPVTLAIGALLALMLYPSVAAGIGIYALAFGDTAASIVGKFFGKIEIPGFNKKTVEGYFACFVAIFIVTYLVIADVGASLCIALVASTVELIPVKDIDNILIPLVAGMTATALI